MLKKSTLAIVVASSILVSSIVVAETKDSSIDSMAEKERKIVPVQRDEIFEYVKIGTGDSQITKTIPKYKKNEYGGAYALSLTVISFNVNDKNSSITEDFLKIDNELKKSTNIEDVFSKYCKVYKVENKVQSLIAGYNNSTINKQTIDYASKVTNGVQSRDYLEIISYQNIILNDKLTDNKLALFLNTQDSQLDSMEKIDVNESSTKSYIQSPSVSTYRMDQSVVLKAGEYKLVNLTNTNDNTNPLFKNLSSRAYRAVVVKVLSQGT